MIKIFYCLLALAIHPIHAKTILFIGDSLTAGYGVAKEAGYPQQMKRMFEKEGIDVQIVNAAVSGATTSSGLSRYNHFKKKNPHIVVIALGANDGLRGIDPKVTYNNLKKLITAVAENKRKILFIGMKLPPNYGKMFVKKFIQVFSSLAEEYELPFVPFLLDKVGGEKKYNQSDGTHPNEEGHKIMAQTVYPYLKKLVSP